MRKREFLTLLILLILTRIADDVLTYKITRDLSRELNPLVSIFGFGWTGLIFVALFILVPTVWISYKSIFHPFNNFPSEDLSFVSFKKFNFSAANPNLKAHAGKIIIQTLGYIVPRVFIIWGVWVIAHNILVLINNPTYAHLRSEYKIWLIGYILPGVLGVTMTNPFLIREFNRYQSKT